MYGREFYLGCSQYLDSGGQMIELAKSDFRNTDKTDGFVCFSCDYNAYCDLPMKTDEDPMDDVMMILIIPLLGLLLNHSWYSYI